MFETTPLGKTRPYSSVAVALLLLILVATLPLISISSINMMSPPGGGVKLSVKSGGKAVWPTTLGY